MYVAWVGAGIATETEQITTGVRASRRATTGPRARHGDVMATAAHGPHSNPVWSTFIFVMCMLLFLFYLETMIRPMDLLVSRSFVMPSNLRYAHGHQLNGSVIAKHWGLSLTAPGLEAESPGASRFQTTNVLVFLHVQKTAGKAYNAHVALDLDAGAGGPGCTCLDAAADDRELDLLAPGSCVCDLDKAGPSTWLFSRLTVGWPCGVHAGLTELTVQCMDKELNHRENRVAARKYFVFTILRDPLSRYVSEWHQVTSHGQWPIKKLYCHPLADKSYFNGNWTGVTLDGFLGCPDNPANNRQVRMLADLQGLSCPDVKSVLSGDVHNNSILQNAMTNLRQLPFFGLMEHPLETDILFERAFGVKFSSGFASGSRQSRVKLTAEQRQRIMQNNKLDVEFYNLAKTIFFERLKTVPKSLQVAP